MKQFSISTLFITFAFVTTIYSETDLVQGEWIPLFDGTTTEHWRGYNQDTLPSNWKIIDSALCADGTVGDIVTKQQFDNFELQLEYRVSKGGNSGLFFYVKEDAAFDKIWRTGIEMQIMDNANNPLGQKSVKHQTGSLFALYPPTKDHTKPFDQWNWASIIVKKGTVQYFINKKEVLKYQLWTDTWYADREQTMHNKTRKPLWGEFHRGHIALQDEGFSVAYRSIKIRELKDTTLTTASNEFIPVAFLDDSKPKQREGHYVHYLMSKWWGTTGGFNSLVGVYTAKDFVYTGTHEDQEMFYVISGHGWAKVGTREFAIIPGACWVVPPKTEHGIKCAATSEGVKAFVVHGKP